ncbi:MAG: hypothetical protein IIB00_05860 [candidate division Zixibacteria bacterium]|nr:hypothetical protein [candidate division Zixibacteria bacterium]
MRKLIVIIILALGVCAQTTGAVTFGVGKRVGLTFYDNQKEGSMNRQLATRGFDHCIYFSWSNSDNNSAVGGLNVRGNTWDASLGGLSEPQGLGIDIGGDLGPPTRGFSTTQDAFQSGTSVIALHWDPVSAVPFNFRPNVFIDDIPCLVDFVELFSGGIVPESLWVDSLSSGGTYFAWPRVAATDDGVCGKMIHLVIHDNGQSGKYMYIRRTIGAGGSTDSNWTDGYIFGQGGFRTPAITASRQSQKVGIAWSGGRGDGTEFGASVDRYDGDTSGQWDNDLYYMESQDCGATWGPIRNITQYPDDSPGGFRAHARVTVIYDSRDSLHMAWAAAKWNGYSGPFRYSGKILHYDTESKAVRTAVNGQWNPRKCNGGAYNLNVTQPQLSVCDNKLYLSYVEFANPLRGHGDDCHVRYPSDPTGAANGDIMLTVSDNWGYNWDYPRGLTKTYTPDCDTIPGGANLDCQSDTWHSATRYGIDITGDDFDGLPDVSDSIGGYAGNDYIFVQYINDREPGAAILNEGSWTLSTVRAFRFGCVEDVASAVLSSSLEAGQTIDSSFHVFPGNSVPIPWVLENTGKNDLTYNLNITSISPAGNISVAGPSGFISAGANNSETLTLTLNANNDTARQYLNAVIVIDGNFASSPDTFRIEYAVVDTSSCCDLPGDADDGGDVNIGDAIFILKYIFVSDSPKPPCCDQADADGGGDVNIGDISYIVSLALVENSPGAVCPNPGGLVCL